MNDKIPELLTTSEAAKILKVDVSTVTRLAKGGVLRGTRAFGDWRFDAEDLRKTIERNFNEVSGLHARTDRISSRSMVRTMCDSLGRDFWILNKKKF